MLALMCLHVCESKRHGVTVCAILLYLPDMYVCGWVSVSVCLYPPAIIYGSLKETMMWSKDPSVAKRSELFPERAHHPWVAWWDAGGKWQRKLPSGVHNEEPARGGSSGLRC